MGDKIELISNVTLSANWFVLRNYTYWLTTPAGKKVRHKREVYDRGDGATILLYNREKNSIILIRQFRIATWVNGNADGMLLESCAGLLEKEAPEVCIRREVIEETGYDIGEIEKLFQLYMSPGGVTECIHFFAAEYSQSQRVHEGGGVEDEEIEVLEFSFPQAMAMVAEGRIQDGKLVILLQHALLRGWLHL